MDKEEWKSFFRFLDEANEGELRMRLDKAREVLTIVRSPEVRSDARRVVRLLEQELLIRQGRPASRGGSR
jgi:hypothetical protein